MIAMQGTREAVVPKTPFRFLHVGCGSATKEQTTRLFGSDEWEEVRFDIDPEVSPDIIGSITDMSNITAQYDAIYSSHVIEHLYAHEVSVALKNFYRVLSPSGYLVLSCPDLQEVGKHIAEGNLLSPLYDSKAGPVAALDIVYGLRSMLARGHVYMAHKCGFTISSLAQEVEQAGFRSVLGFRHVAAFSLHILATKPIVEEKTLQALAMQHWS